jgi:amino acid permease
MSYLGWGWGLLTLTLLCAASIYTSYLLSELHEDPSGRRHNTYREIGEAVWGRRAGWWAVAPVQYTLMVGLCVTYSVTAGQSMKGVASAECDGADCAAGLAPWILAFGAGQLALSMVPDFHSLWWVSLLGALMSVGYCGIAAAASAAAAAAGPAPDFSRAGQAPADRAFGVLSALGSVAFTFGGQAVLPEIQATLARPPATPRAMMRGIWAAYAVVVVAYYSVAIAGYAAFGAAVQSDVLLSIKHPAGLVTAANLMVVVHVAAGYQIFAMPLFDRGEAFVRRRMRGPPPRPALLRAALRSAFVAATTATACALPFFGELMVRQPGAAAGGGSRGRQPGAAAGGGSQGRSVFALPLL